MWTWALLCVCVAYVSGQVVVPPLSEENQRATEDHLAALTRATKAHIEAHKNLPQDEALFRPRQRQFFDHDSQPQSQSFSHQPQHRPSFSQFSQPQEQQPSFSQFSHQQQPQHHAPSFSDHQAQSFSHQPQRQQQSFADRRQKNQDDALALKKATEEHLAAVAAATKAHFAAHSANPGPEGGEQQQPFAHQSQHQAQPSFAAQPQSPFSQQGFAAQPNALPSNQSPFGFNPSSFNPHTFGGQRNRFF